MAKLIVAEAVEKTTKTGKSYLNVKSSTGKFYSIWEESRYIWHLFVPQAELDVTVATNGAFTNITGVVGVSEPNKSGGTTLYKTPTEPLAGAPNAWDKLWLRLDKMEKAIDFLVDEKMTLDSLKAMKKEKAYSPTFNLEDLPNLSDLPEHNLD
jgi:hypothetical protein